MADSASGAAMEAALPCLNFPVNVRSLPPKGLALTLETNENERAALAKAHGLLAVHKFSAALQLKPWKKQGVRLEGRIEAEIEQLCIITAEPLRNIIKKDFEAYYVPEGSRLARPAGMDSSELFLDPEGADAPESFSGGSINAGAVAEEFFELAIDLYPRKAGARLADMWQPAEGAAAAAGAEAAAADEDRPQSPFAALENLRRQ